MFYQNPPPPSFGAYIPTSLQPLQPGLDQFNLQPLQPQPVSIVSSDPNVQSPAPSASPSSAWPASAEPAQPSGEKKDVQPSSEKKDVENPSKGAAAGDEPSPPEISLFALFKLFLWFGCNAFGGPVVQIA